MASPKLPVSTIDEDEEGLQQVRILYEEHEGLLAFLFHPGTKSRSKLVICKCIDSVCSAIIKATKV